MSNNRTGTMRIEDSTLRRNPNDGFQTAGLPGHLLPRQRPNRRGQLDDPALNAPTPWWDSDRRGSRT